MTFENTPSVLSFRRAMVLSDALFYSLVDGQEKPVHVMRHGIAGTQNTDNAKDDPRNLQVTDTAKLHHDSSTLIVKLSLRMLDIGQSLEQMSGLKDLKPFMTALNRFIDGSKGSHGLRHVASRFAHTILNGGWLWRNRSIAQSISITVSVNNENFIVDADASQYPINDFNGDSDDKKRLTDIIFKQLCGENSQSLDITATVETGVKGVEVYPSQLYVQDKPKGFARPLYNVGSKQRADNQGMERLGIAALRDQKVGNKLRCFDTWYPSFADIGRAIAIEPVGANLEDIAFYRDKASSAFNMLKRIAKIDPNTTEGMFLMTTLLIRGGVYSGSGDKK